jgi:hypothetical protein
MSRQIVDLSKQNNVLLDVEQEVILLLTGPRFKPGLRRQQKT